PMRTAGICAWLARSARRRRKRGSAIEETSPSLCPDSIVNKLSFAVAAFIAIVACNNTAQSQMTDVSGARIRAHVKFLASDLLEGRAPGSRGGDLATEYVATQFALAGAKPAGDNGTYYQNFKLVGVAPQPDSQLTAIPLTGTPTNFKWLDDFVGVTQLQIPDAQFEAQAVF